jgi:hypothetical protein
LLLTSRERQKGEMEKEAALLAQSLKTNNAAPNATENKVAMLTDDNKLLLQEKAAIQGQFEQLQRSLRS